MKKGLLFLLMVAGLAGCASGPTAQQTALMDQYKAAGVAVTAKDPGTAAVLGILPGGGSFYTGHIGLGIVNLIFWPTSILWDPVSGHNGALMANFDATAAKVKYEKGKAENDLQSQLQEGKISKDDFLIKQRALDQQYPQ